MSEKYNPVAFDPRTFAEEAGKRDLAFREAYEGMADECAALAELLRARTRAGLTQTELAERMGVSRQTFDRIVLRAHKKIGAALVNGQALRIQPVGQPATAGA